MYRRQCAAIPYRHGERGLEVLLVTTRGTGRWVVPKGWIDPGKTPGEMAAIEAYEEAGVRGRVHKRPAGTFRYDKVRRNGSKVPCVVTAFLLQVHEELDDWPEKGERRRLWLPPAEAAGRVQEDGLRHMLDTLARRHPARPG